MKLIIRFNDKKYLPKIDDLVYYMWNKNINFSKAGNSTKLATITSLSLCWDKWVDDIRFNTHPKFKEYIYFEQLSKSKNPPTLSIEVDNDALFIDKRAFYRAGLIIAQKTQGEISFDQQKWMKPNEFFSTYNEIIKFSFENAVEVSLKEVVDCKN